MTHLAILLDGWDWIQLANIDRKATAHPGLVVTTLENQIDADSTSQEIKAKAALVKAQVAKFFEDFDKVLAEFQVPNQDMVVGHSAKAHKKTYA